MERHCSNAMKIAEFLSEDSRVSWVNYPGLKNHKTHKNAVKYLKHGFGGMLSFGVKGGVEAGNIEGLRIFSHVANVGDVRSLAVHPASTTHGQLSEEEQLASGVSPDMIRLSVGIEDIDDLIEDIDSALTKATNN